MEGRRWGGGVRGKVEVMYELLATQPWQSMPLQVRYADEYGWGVHELISKRSDRERKEWEKVQARLVDEEERRVERMKRHIYALPAHMPLTVGPFDELDMYTYRRLRRERRKGRMEAGEAVAGVTPGEYGESEVDDALLDEERMVSGEESDNSGESDVEIIEQTTDNDDNALYDDDWTSFPLTQREVPHGITTTSTFSSSSRPPSSTPPLTSTSAHCAVATQLRCGLCFRRSEVGEGGHGGFFSGCDQCRFVGHLTCIVQHIFKQMQKPESPTAAQLDTELQLTQSAAALLSSSSDLSPPTRFASNPASLFSFSPAFPPTIFSSLPSSIPLLPPLSTGTCPTCNARLSYPLLIERCRYMHEGKDGRRGGDVWYEEADELSISKMVREYAGRAGELKAKEKEEQVKRKKADGEEKKRKRKAHTAAAADSSSGNESASTDSSTHSPKRKRKSTASKKERKSTERAATSSHPSQSSILPQVIVPAVDSERDKENVDGLRERKTAKVGGRKKPNASRRVGMQGSTSVAPALFTLSQPAPSAAVPSACAPVRLSVSLSDDDDVLVVTELSSADKRRQLMAEAAERRLGKSATAESYTSTQHSAVVVSDVSLLAVKGSGALQAAEPMSDLTASRDYVKIDDEESDDDVLALDTETEEEEVSGKSLSERLKARADSMQLVASLQDIR